MYKIGAFAALAGLSVKTLHHYDAIGLLRPAGVDPDSGYRLYAEGQLAAVRRIGELKAMGLSLEQVRGLLERDDPAALRRAVEAQQVALLRELGEARRRLARADAALRELDAAAAPQEYPVELAEAGPLLVAGIRARIPVGTVHRLFAELREHLDAHGAGDAHPALTLAYHEEPYDPAWQDLEAAYALPAPLPEGGRVRVRELPAARVARVVHRGDYRQMRYAYEALGRWIDERGLAREAPWREIYLRDYDHVEAPAELLTEIAIPVAEPAAAEAGGWTVLGSAERAGVRFDYVARPDTPPVAALLPGYLPPGLRTSQQSSRFFIATDAAGAVVLSWAWLPPGGAQIMVDWDRALGEPPAAEDLALGGRPAVLVPAAGGQPAQLAFALAGGHLYLTGAGLPREELLRVAASFPAG